MSAFVVAGLMAVAGCGLLGWGGGQYAETAEEGFVPLFNGKDLTGWAGATELYGVDEREPGVLQCFPERRRALPAGKRGDLWTERSFTNFVLRFEFCMSENGNNGLGIRMVPCKDAAYHGMCELQMLDDGGSEYHDAEKGKDKLEPWRYSFSAFGIVPARRDNGGSPSAPGAGACGTGGFAGGGSWMKKPGAWNFAEVRVVGGSVRAWLNGHCVLDADLWAFRGDGDTPDGKPHPGIRNASGPIGWLGHGYNVKWRDIRIREIVGLDGDRDSRSVGAACPKGFRSCSAPSRRQCIEEWDGSDCEIWADWRYLSSSAEPVVALRCVPLVPHRADGSVRPVGDWSRLHAKASGGRVWAWIDGRQVAEGVTPGERVAGESEGRLTGFFELRNVFVRDRRADGARPEGGAGKTEE